MKKTHTPSKPLDISNATAWVATNLFEAKAILSYIVVRTSAVDQEDLKPNHKSGKRPHFCKWSTIILFTRFPKILWTTERRLTGKLLALDLSPAFLNTGTTNETLQQSGKQDPSRHLLKSSASMYERSDSKFFRNITGI